MDMLIGIDGGGTKTDLCLAREDGHLLKYDRGLGTNPADLGMAECERRLLRELDCLLSNFNGRSANIVSVYAGIAGSGSAETKRALNAALIRLLPNARIVDNATDGFNALYGESEAGEGISLIAGTGSSAFALSNGEIHQVGGWGYLIDDAGSGYRLGAEALRAAYRAVDGRGEKTLLVETCEKQLEIPLLSAIPKIYEGGKRYVASFSYAALEAAKRGDAVAEGIITDAARALAEHLRVCTRHLHVFPAVTVICGGLIEHEEMLERVRKELGADEEKFRIVKPDIPPVYGSLVKAAWNAGIKADGNFRANFIADFKSENAF